MKVSQYIKNKEAIIAMREAGRAAAQVLEMIEPYVQPGTTTEDLNERCHRFMVDELKVIPAPLNYRGFPKSICTSVNHVVCHGIPKDKPLKKGDIINIDVTVIKNGYHGDTSRMFTVGDVSVLSSRLMKIAQECLYLGIQMVKPGVNTNDIGGAIERYAKQNHMSSVHEYCGHGIGTHFHEPSFQMLHYDNRSGDSGILLEEGLTFTIEPMINAGKREVKVLGDEWTVVTRDRALSAQWEHTLLVTANGCEVLTLRKDETIHPII